MYPDERVTMYIRRVCARIPWPIYRLRVQKELTDHILTHAEYLHNERGFSPDEAVEEAVRLMGDPDYTGRELNRAHSSPRRLCRLAGTLLIWLGIISCTIWLYINLR